MLGKLIGQIIAAPIKIIVQLPEAAMQVVEEVGKAVSNEEREGKKP